MKNYSINEKRKIIENYFLNDTGTCFKFTDTKIIENVLITSDDQILEFFNTLDNEDIFHYSKN